MAGLDHTLLTLVNGRLANPAFDWFLPRMASLGLMLWVLVPAALWLVWRGGFRGRLFALCVLLGLSLGEGLVLNPLKHATGRHRPWQQVEGVRHVKPESVRVVDAAALATVAPTGRSFPSSHAANNVMWPLFAVLIWGARRAGWLLAWSALMMLSRVYTGDHFPSDVCAGALLAACYTLALATVLERAWSRWGVRFAPTLHAAHPVLFSRGGAATR